MAQLEAQTGSASKEERQALHQQMDQLREDLEGRIKQAEQQAEEDRRVADRILAKTKEEIEKKDAEISAMRKRLEDQDAALKEAETKRQQEEAAAEEERKQREAEQAALAGLQGAISSENIVQLKQAITGAEKLDFAPPELEEAGRLLAQLQVRHCHVMCSAAFPLFSLRFLLSGRMFVRHDV